MGRRTYTGTDIDVTFDLGRCMHAAECVRGLPVVFNTKAKPWINPANAGADEIAEVVERCPSGALRYDRKAGSAEAPTENRIAVRPDGPLFVRGRIAMGGAEPEDVRMALCRCGKSQNKPFCDNRHKEGFADPGTGEARDLGEIGEGDLSIQAFDDGPLFLTGDFEVVDAEGDVLMRGGNCALCRCGASGSKPFCDGSHKRVGFTSA